MVRRAKGKSRFGYKLNRQGGQSKRIASRWANNRRDYEFGPKRNPENSPEYFYPYSDDEFSTGYGNRVRRRSRRR